jgi:hypothetical protein
VKRILMVLTVALVMVAIVVVTAMPGIAKITPAECETRGGNNPPGQGQVCQGEGLVQKPAKNPAGKEPPGQQPTEEEDERPGPPR